MLRGASPAVQREFRSIDWHTQFQGLANIATGLRTERRAKVRTESGLSLSTGRAEEHAAFVRSNANNGLPQPIAPMAQPRNDASTRHNNAQSLC